MTRNESCGSTFQALNLLGSGKVAGERGKKGGQGDMKVVSSFTKALAHVGSENA